MTARFAKLACMICCVALVFPMTASAQVGGGGGGGGGNNGNGNNFGNIVNLVGGVKIDTDGVLTNAPVKLDANVRRELERGLSEVDRDMQRSTKMRMISLRGLEQAITQAKDEGKPLSREVIYMAGLQRIEYIVLSPEENDIILAGPADGIKVTENGDVVGATTGTPVLRLEDFLVAMRSTENARTGTGISVSIDPTENGIKQLQGLFSRLRRANQPFNPAMQANVEQAMGDQMITLTGVPTDSRFSQVLVAADYKMKRLSMGLEQAPISNFPSFMEIAQRANAKKVVAAPRFWMECHYEPVAKSADGNIWQIRGQGVKTLTEESRFDRNGKKSQTGKQNRFAKQWADSMTERFDELAKAEPAFRELRNLMDLSVVAAILEREQLTQKMELDIPAIRGLTNAAITPSRSVPKTVPAQCSFVKIAQSWLVSASGGVQLDPWGVAGKTESADMGQLAQTALQRTRNAWWWNAN